MKKIKIGLVSDFLPSSGMTNFCTNYFRCNDDIDVYPISIGNKKKSLKFFSDTNITNWHKPQFIHPANENLFLHILNWHKILKRNRGKIDVYYINSSASWNFIPIILLLIYKCKIIIHSHSDNYSHLPSTKSKLKLLNFANNIGKLVYSNKRILKFSCSKNASEWLFSKAQSKKATIINNAFNLELFAYKPSLREKLRQELNISDNEIIIGHVGILSKRKNQAFIIETLKHLKNSDFVFKVVLIGDGPDRNELQKKVSDYQLSNSVIFLGDNSSAFEYYNIFDLFIFPSISEGFGLALVEAQTNGLMCYVSKSVPDSAVLLKNACKFDLSNDIKILVDSIKEDIKKCSFLRTNDSVEVVRTAGFDINIQKDVLFNNIRGFI